MSNPRIGWPSNVSGSPSASRSTGTTTPAAATDPVGTAVIAPWDTIEPGNRLARRHADSGEDAERERADHGGDREWSHGRPTPPRHEPDHRDGNGAGDRSDDPADDPWNRGVAHGRRRSRAAEHRSGPYAEPETDRDDRRGDEGRIAMTTRSRLRTVRLGLRHGGDANGSSTPREALTEQRRESPNGTDVR